MNELNGLTVLVTGGGRRIGRYISLTAAGAGADVIVHYAGSAAGADKTAEEIRKMGRQAYTIQQDFRQTTVLETFCQSCWDLKPFDILVNNASIFENQSFNDTTLEDWEKHLAINLTAPFLLSRQFAELLPAEKQGRIINLLDWRALRPGKDHFPYTISKAALAALTKSMATAAAPYITVNGLALGAILPPENKAFDEKDILDNYPAQRWGELSEVGEAFLFLASGPTYMTGEILTLDGGRHLI